LQVTAQEQKLEGEFRYTHSRIITHAEEIAFYKGSDTEKQGANKSFDTIYRHVETGKYLSRWLMKISV
jgi:ATP-binding cassette subfamily D (ALD) protein 3